MVLLLYIRDGKRRRRRRRRRLPLVRDVAKTREVLCANFRCRVTLEGGREERRKRKKKEREKKETCYTSCRIKNDSRVELRLFFAVEVVVVVA